MSIVFSNEIIRHGILQLKCDHIRAEDLLGAFPEAGYGRVLSDRLSEKLVEEPCKRARPSSEQFDFVIGIARDLRWRDETRAVRGRFVPLLAIAPARIEGERIAQKAHDVDDVQVSGRDHVEELGT